jgi:outer membrane lipoprotein-sorting protein
MNKVLTFLLVVSGALVMSLATSLYAVDGSQLLVQIDKNLSPESYESYRKIINVEPSGRKKEYVYYTAKKGKDKIVGFFLSPASDKGRSTLRLGDNMWLYVPNVGKPIRITSLQSVIGGVFNNADILALDYSEEYNVEKVEEQGNEYLLFCKAKTKTVAYDRLKMWVDKQRVIPTKIECLTEADMLIKTLYLKDIKDFGGGVVRPADIETDSPLYKGYKSIMLFAKIKKREFRDEVFTLTFMPNMESLVK